LGLSLYAQNDSSSYSFYVAGHTYGAPGVNNIGFHPAFKQKFGYIQSRPEINFGILTGDIVSQNPIAQDWDEIDADVISLGLPVHFAVGNHDMENRPLFESRYGQTYYHFIHQNDLFIILDPNIDSWNISGLQKQFLEDVLDTASLTTDNIYVFFHQILWRESNNQFNYIAWNSSAGRDSTVNFWPEIEPLFSSLPNEVIMFAGDLGASWSSDITYDKYSNITLIATGMGHPDGENFIVVNVDSNKAVNYDLICLSDTNMNCLGDLTDYLVVDHIVSIDNLYDKNIYINSIYPNPASNKITISTENLKETSLQLFNTQGKLILERKLISQIEYTVDISNIPKGIYIVKVFNYSNQSTSKLVIR
jgi:hypothetical protein